MTDFKEYSAIEAVNWSALKHMARSPLHYRYYVDNERKDSYSLARGRAVHTAILEPDRFPLDYVVFDGKVRRGKEWEAFKEVNGKKTILKRDEYLLCLRIRDAVRRNPIARKYLEQGEPERSIEWKDADTGLRCKGRIDWLCSVVLDVKTCRDIDARRFGSTAARFGYHGQAAFYADGAAAATGRARSSVLLAVEHEPPHDVAIFEVGEDELEAGRDEYRMLLRRVAECTESGHWPGKYEDEQQLSLPSWVWPEDEQEMTARVLGDDEWTAQEEDHG